MGSGPGAPTSGPGSACPSCPEHGPGDDPHARASSYRAVTMLHYTFHTRYINQSSDPCNISTCYKSATTKPPTTVTPTRLPVSSTPTSQTTYAKDHQHTASTVKSTGAVNATTAATHKVNGTVGSTVKPAMVASHGNGTTPKPVRKIYRSADAGGAGGVGRSGQMSGVH